MRRNTNNKRRLYESIMRDVARTVKRHLNENSSFNKQFIYVYVSFDSENSENCYTNPNKDINHPQIAKRIKDIIIKNIYKDNDGDFENSKICEIINDYVCGIFKYYNDIFKSALGDDLNTSNALTCLFDVLKDDSINDDTKLYLVSEFDKVLSLSLLEEKKVDNELLNKINELIEKRNIAKSNKDYELADKIRNELLDMNVVIKDTREGTIFEVR